MQYSAVQCSAVQFSAMQYSAVQYSTVKCNAVQCMAVIRDSHSEGDERMDETDECSCPLSLAVTQLAS